MKFNPSILFTILVAMGFYVLWTSRKILLNKERNAWDVLFLNPILALIALFFIGLVANNLEIWKWIIGLLGIIAVGERLTGVLCSGANSNSELSPIGKISDLLEKSQGIRVHYLLLCFSFALLFFALIFDRYFTTSLYLFIYSIGLMHIQLLRKQEWLEGFSERFRKRFYLSIFIFFVIWSLFWFATLLLVNFKY